MRVLPILFNTEMVKAILEGRKTVTRRVIKPQPVLKNGFWELGGAAWSENIHDLTPIPHHSLYNRMPYKPEDILYVRETFCPNYYDKEVADYYANGNRTLFKTEFDASKMGDVVPEPKWRPAIHMPKEAARIFLRVTNVRVEQLQEITEEGAAAEGLYKGWRIGDRGSLALSARQGFMWLWGHITSNLPAAECWAANPWVWVIEFERCEKPEDWP